VNQLRELPVAAIERDPTQPRQDFDQRGLEELAASIQSEGLLQPTAVRCNGDGRFTLVAGERRWRAVRMLNWEKVPAIVLDGLDERQVKRVQLLENVVRRDLSPVEVARAYRAMMDQGMTAQEIGRAVGKPAGDVTWLVGILKCREDVLHLVHRGQMTPTLAWHIGRLSPEGQARALREIVSRDMKLQEAVLFCDRLWAQENQAQAFKEEKLRRAQSVRLFRAAFDRAVRAVNDLWKYEERYPGSLVQSLGQELDTARLKVRELRKAVERLERALDDEY